MKSIGKSVWTMLSCFLVVSFFCSSCAYVDKWGYFEPKAENGWQEYQHKYEKTKRFHFIAQNIIFEISSNSPMGINSCFSGLIFPVVPTGDCSDPMFTSDTIEIGLDIWAEKEIDIDTYENFKPTLITKQATYKPVPPGQMFSSSVGWKTQEKWYKNKKKANMHGIPVSYVYSYTFYYKVPEVTLKEFVLEFPTDIPGINLPTLAFTSAQRLRKGLVIFPGP